MLGTIVNSAAIVIGGVMGLVLKKGIPDSYKRTIMQGLGLSVLIIGLTAAFKSQNILLMIFSITLGSVIGEVFRIENKLEKFGYWLEGSIGGGEGTVAKGFVTASLIFCVGAMAIVGSLESGLAGNYETLYAKSLIDGIASIIFASTLGIGVVFSSIAVFLYQGLITMTATFVKPFLAEAVVNEMSAIGGLLIMGISINILDIKKIHVGNMLPAIFIPIFYPIIEPYLMVAVRFLQNLL